MIKNILCPVDRSPSSLQAFSYAIALARWQGARLSLLEVIEAAVPTGGRRVPEDDSVPSDTQAALERDLRRVLTARRTSDVRVEIFMRKGNVVQEILAQAKASRTDLVGDRKPWSRRRSAPGPRICRRESSSARNLPSLDGSGRSEGGTSKPVTVRDDPLCDRLFCGGE